MRVLVTGSASRLAAVLLPQLAADARIQQIIGVDRRDSAFRDDRYTHVLLDTRAPELATVMKRADAVIHLAVAGRVHAAGVGDRDTMRAGNVIGAQNVVRSAYAQGVRRLVLVSTAAVYELPPRSRVIEETHPRRAWPGLAYAEDCGDIENWLDNFDHDRAKFTIVRLRPHFMVGRHRASLLRNAALAPFYIPMTDRPRLQCVHEHDVAQAIVAALYQDTRGAFNLACADAATFEEIKRMQRRMLVPIALPLARGLLRFAGRLGAGLDPAWIEALRYHLVLDSARARKQLGWRPRYDSVAACFKALRSSHHG